MENDIYGRTVTSTDNGNGTTTYTVGSGEIILTVETSRTLDAVYNIINAMGPATT